MASIQDAVPHEERTSKEPRHDGIHSVRVHDIKEVTNTRVIDLRIDDPKNGIKFLPGQWLDTFIPGIPQAGGFTITSTPHQASPEHVKHPFLQLAVRHGGGGDPRTNPTAWLWKDLKQIIGQQLFVRVGGSFVWPPPSPPVEEIEKVVFIAGGVGINPLISMLSHLHSTKHMPPKVEFLYSTRAPDKSFSPSSIPFLPLLIEISSAWPTNVELTLFLSGAFEQLEDPENFPWHHARRFGTRDLELALGADVSVRRRTVCYVCGRPEMTDEFVKFLEGREGMAKERVLCERWW